MKKKQIFKMIKFSLILICVVLILFMFVNNKYDFFSSKGLFEKTNVVVKGDFPKDKIPSISIDSNSNFLPFLRKKEIQIDNLDDIQRVYNIFEIDNLTPYSNYKKTLQLKIEGIPIGTKMIYGFEDKKIEELTSKSEDVNSVLVNIDEDNAETFFKGNSNYLELPIEFSANGDGKAYIYLGMDTKGLYYVKYKISQVRILN